MYVFMFECLLSVYCVSVCLSVRVSVSLVSYSLSAVLHKHHLILFYAILCCVMLFYAILFCFMLYYSILCCLMLSYAILFLSLSFRCREAIAGMGSMPVRPNRKLIGTAFYCVYVCVTVCV